LQGLGAELSLPAGPPGIKKDRCIAVARALLDGAGEPLGPGRFERLTRVLRSLQPLLDTAKCQEVVNRVAPFCWVNPDAAASLRASADEPGGAVAWRRQWPLSEPMYLRRAFCSPDVFPVWVSDAGAWGGGLEHGLAHLRSCLLRRLGLPEGATDESIRRALELWRRSGRRVCLVMPLASVDAPLLGQARRCWPSSCFFLHDPNLTRPAFEQYGFDSVRFLEPELTAEAEYDARVSWTGLMLEAGADEGHVYSGEAYS
jgi:hypothetical protein